MGIITKEKAAEVVPFSFGAERGDLVEASSWQLPTDGHQALPEPEVAPPNGLDPASEIGMDSLESEPSQVPPPPPPVFEVPEEILAGFYEQVVMAGLEDGRTQVLAELKILQERFAAALEGLGAVSQQLASQNQVQIMALACQIAGRLVRDEIQLKPERLLALIAESLSTQDASDSVVVRCSAGDYEYIVSQKPQLEAGVGAAFTVRVELDESLEYGDFQIDTRKGQIDGRVDVRIAEIKQGLEEGTDV